MTWIAGVFDLHLANLWHKSQTYLPTSLTNLWHDSKTDLTSPLTTHLINDKGASNITFDTRQRRVSKVWQRRPLSPATACKGVVKDDLWRASKVVKSDQMWSFTRLYPHLWPTTKMIFRAVFYIGKTKRRLHDRKTEHFKALTKSGHPSEIADHITSTGHNIKWDHLKF